MENNINEKDKQSQEDWKMIKEHKPFYVHGNNVSYSEDFVKRYKTKILINTFIYIVLILAFLTATICFGVIGYQDPAKNKPLCVVMMAFIPMDIVVIVFAVLNFVFNHVYTKQNDKVFVALYCNWWWKVLEVNKVQKDYGSYSKVMKVEEQGFVITVKGKDIDIQEKNYGKP